MKNPKVGKVKTGKQIICHVTAPMSGQFLKSRSEDSSFAKSLKMAVFGCKKMGLGGDFARDEWSDLDFKNCPDIGAVTW